MKFIDWILKGRNCFCEEIGSVSMAMALVLAFVCKHLLNHCDMLPALCSMVEVQGLRDYNSRISSSAGSNA